MLDKLEAIKARFEDLGVALSNPQIVSDNNKYKQLSKEYRNLEKIVTLRNEYAKVLDDIEFNNEMMNSDDDEIRALAKEEIDGLYQKKDTYEKQIRNMLIPEESAG